jgi:hypothetical protein
MLEAEQACKEQAAEKQRSVVARKYQREHKDPKEEAIILEMDMVNHQQSRRQQH